MSNHLSEDHLALIEELTPEKQKAAVRAIKSLKRSKDDARFLIEIAIREAGEQCISGAGAGRRIW